MEGPVGLDTNILVYSLDPQLPEHTTCRDYILSLPVPTLCPAVIAEAYHTLVFKRGYTSEDSRTKLKEITADKRTAFANHTQRSSLAGMNLAVKYKLGGRDSLILATYLLSHDIEMATHDRELLRLRNVQLNGREILLTNPLA